MKDTITVEELVAIVEKSTLDQTLKDILIRDIKAEGVSEFYIDQVLAYCENAIAALKDKVNLSPP